MFGMVWADLIYQFESQEIPIFFEADCNEKSLSHHEISNHIVGKISYLVCIFRVWRHQMTLIMYMNCF